MRQSNTKLNGVLGREFYLEQTPIRVVPGILTKIYSGLDPVLTPFSFIRCINSVVFGTTTTAGSGMIECQIGVWKQIASGFIRYSVDTSNGVNDLVVEYEGSNDIELGGFSFCYSPVDANQFTQPVDFPPLVVVPPSRSFILQFNNGDAYVAGDEVILTTGTGRLHSVILDFIKDPANNANNKYYQWAVNGTTTTRNIATNGATSNKALYSPGDGLGVKTTNLFSDGYNVFKVNVIDDNNWTISYIFDTYQPDAGQVIKLTNGFNEYFKITSLTV